MKITFDYYDIESHKPFIAFSRDKLKEKDLKSIFMFLNLSGNIRQVVRKRCENILSISHEYEQICEKLEKDRGINDLRIKKVYEATIIK